MPTAPTSRAFRGLGRDVRFGLAERKSVKLPRRQFLHLAAGAVAFPAVLRTACAQTYPSRPVRAIIGFAPGGGVDIVARLIGQWLSERLRQPFIIENRPGTSSTIAAEAVVAAPPDGYTLFWATSANAINATLYDNLSYNFVRDIAPVAGIRLPNVMEVNLSFSGQDRSRIHCLREGQSGKINVATVFGTTLYMAGELFMMMTGVNVLQVPYRGAAAAVTDLLGGEMQVMFDILTGSMQYIKAGRLRALAVTSAARSEALPDMPTVGEFVPGYEASSWNGVGVPMISEKLCPHHLERKANAAATGQAHTSISDQPSAALQYAMCDRLTASLRAPVISTSGSAQPREQH
jgi:tripartite-type tricarboxylate transporter receptor subunit TctC